MLRGCRHIVLPLQSFSLSCFDLSTPHYLPNFPKLQSRDGFPTSVAITDESGSFRFADLEAGTWKLVASRQGFQPEIVDIEVRDQSVTLKRQVARDKSQKL